MSSSKSSKRRKHKGQPPSHLGQSPFLINPTSLLRGGVLETKEQDTKDGVGHNGDSLTVKKDDPNPRNTMPEETFSQDMKGTLLPIDIQVTTEEQQLQQEYHGELTVTTSDMTMGNSNLGTSVMICLCVKSLLFPLVKFWDSKNSSNENYSEEDHFICGKVMKFCKVKMSQQSSAAWWDKAKKTVKIAITNQRNNYIKMMSMKFKGKQKIAGGSMS